MKELIIEILKEIELDKEYVKLCQNFTDFDCSINLNKTEVAPIIKSFDSDFNYIPKDKTFLKETFFKEYSIRFFIGFKNGIIGFGFLVWKEGDINKFYKGNLHTLSKEIDSEFEKKVKYNFPIATSLVDFEQILTKIFSLFRAFEQHFNETVKS